jgi:hypothetical protein
MWEAWCDAVPEVLDAAIALPVGASVVACEVPCVAVRRLS